MSQIEDEDFIRNLDLSPEPEAAPLSIAPPSITPSFETEDEPPFESSLGDRADNEDSEDSEEESQDEPLKVEGATDEDAFACMEAIGLHQESRDGIGDLSKPWMKFHSFNLVKTIEQVRSIVDSAIQNGACALDLECEGLDSRIDYDAEGKPKTRHAIVGYCISVRGVGYYLPIRHRFPKEERDPNLPVEETNAEIKRLCLASQPVLTEAGKALDPHSCLLTEGLVAEKPKLVIYFWHAKFDQEFLYPVTGIFFWHPESFEDGMLSAYVVYTDDDNLGLKEKAFLNLRVTDPETGIEHPYEMIRFEHLFAKETPKSERKIHLLYPDDRSNVTLYGCSDGICTEILCEARKKDSWLHSVKGLKYSYKEVVSESLSPKFRNVLRLEKQVAQAVRELERNRTLMSKAEISSLLEEAKIELEDYYTKITSLAKGKGFENFNPGSPQQLSEFLFGERGLDIKPKPARQPKTDLYETKAEVLESYVKDDPDAPEVLLWVVKYRQVSKVIGTYLTKLEKNTDEFDQLRFNFKQTGAATGRFTAPQGQPDQGFAGVPIQGIPAKIDPKRPKVATSLRRLFVPHPGYIMVKVDYAGQELRAVSNTSGEPLWIKEFLEGSGDLHTLTAQAFFGSHITKANVKERSMGKVANFALIYGGGPQAIMRATKCDKVEASRRKANFDKSVPVFAAWVKKQFEAVKKNLGVKTAFGRFIAIPDANIKVGGLDNRGRVVTDEKVIRSIRSGCERKSVNYPIQGAGADIIKISLSKLVKKFHRLGWLRDGGDDSVRMLMTVHDEIVFEIRKERIQDAMPVIKQIMESPARMVGWKVPLIVEPLFGLHWGDKYDWGEVMSGDEKHPVPEFLEGYITPDPNWKDKADKDGNPSGGGSSPPIVPPIPRPAKKVETSPKADSAPSSAPPSRLKGSAKFQVAVFRIATTKLTSRSVTLFKKAVIESRPSTGEKHLDPWRYYLRLEDTDGNTLVSEKLNPLQINPEALSRELRGYDLGPGSYNCFTE
jgi:DNA polymerase I-like protein with 3'-5' exonuclease and polymerase domains